MGWGRNASFMHTDILKSSPKISRRRLEKLILREKTDCFGVQHKPSWTTWREVNPTEKYTIVERQMINQYNDVSWGVTLTLTRALYSQVLGTATALEEYTIKPV